MVVIDLKSSIDFGHKTFTVLLKGPTDVQRTDSFLTTVRFLAKTQIRQMCSTISRQPSDKNFFLFRSVPVHGFCPDNISAESSRHRDLPASNATKALPLWHPRKCFTQHLGKRKRASRLENICRLRTSLDKQSSKALRRRRLRNPVKARGLRPGFNKHRFMSFTVSMGKVSQTQSRSQGTYANGPERLYTLFYPHYRRKSTRCKYPRRTGIRAGCILHNGSCLPRFCSSLYIHSKPFIFCYQSQKQFRLPSPLLSQGRQSYRLAMRPDNKAQWLLHIAGLSRRPSSNKLLRCRDQQEIRILNKQLCSAGFDYCSALQMSLADRNLLQMDQAVPANQNIFRHDREHGKDSNLDCYQRLRSGSDRQERTRNRPEFGRNPANSQHCTFRESSYYTSTYEKSFAKQKYSYS
jgi:hypothetical protein